MPTDLPIELDGWDVVSESLDEFRAAGEDSGRFFAEWFGQVGSWLSRLLAEQARWRGECDRTGEDDPWAPVLGELARTRDELAEARTEIQRLAQPIASFAEEAPARRASEQMQAEMDTMRDERDAMRAERSLLEAELENVRRRAGQLAETLDEQKRAAAEQESYWRGEFRRQCALVERLTGQWMQAFGAGLAAPAEDHDPAAQVSSATTAGQPRDGNASGGGRENPALESIRAQFELLQREAARRRRENNDSA